MEMASLAAPLYRAPHVNAQPAAAIVATPARPMGMLARLRCALGGHGQRYWQHNYETACEDEYCAHCGTRTRRNV
jgi:hypothetical protein